MVMRNHELVKSVAYPYWFSPEVETWREETEDGDGDASASISIEFLELSVYSGPNPPVRFSPIISTVRAFQNLVLSVQGATGEL
ncbi:hypothetical protein AYI68_g210 [Smittium mucronatum]|uniref:Uncharacterized protein n=1 Tax=Smittium mucronatum TaxID=133383 RepID=A0A1R0H905_9FUNG|nr:hypothetical protein AYI68_g210 [Smittium mucronatum]